MSVQISQHNNKIIATQKNCKSMCYLRVAQPASLLAHGSFFPALATCLPRQTHHLLRQILVAQTIIHVFWLAFMSPASVPSLASAVSSFHNTNIGSSNGMRILVSGSMRKSDQRRSDLSQKIPKRNQRENTRQRPRGQHQTPNQHHGSTRHQREQIQRLPHQDQSTRHARTKPHNFCPFNLVTRFGASTRDCQQVPLVDRIGDVHVLLSNCQIHPSSPLVQLDRLRRGDEQIGHQLRFPLHVLYHVTFERDGNASGVTSRVPAATADQHRQCFVLLLHHVRDVVGLHLAHLAHEVLQLLHSNRRGPQLLVRMHLASATMQICVCASFTLSQTYTPVKTEVLQSRLPANPVCRAHHTPGTTSVSSPRRRALPYVARGKHLPHITQYPKRERARILPVFWALLGQQVIIALGLLLQVRSPTKEENPGSHMRQESHGK